MGESVWQLKLSSFHFHFISSRFLLQSMFQRHIFQFRFELFCESSIVSRWKGVKQGKKRRSCERFVASALFLCSLRGLCNLVKAGNDKVILKEIYFEPAVG